MAKRSGCPSSSESSRGKNKADARKYASFSGIGGSVGDPVSGGGGGSGSGNGGGKTYHGAAKAKENVSPPDAKAYASFSGIGGKNTANKI